MKIPSDLLENWHSSQLEGTEYEFDIGILRSYIENLYLGKLVPKLKFWWFIWKFTLKDSEVAEYKSDIDISRFLFKA